MKDHKGGGQDHDEFQGPPFLHEAHGHKEAEEEHHPEDDGPGFRLLAKDDAQEDQQQESGHRSRRNSLGRPAEMISLNGYVEKKGPTVDKC